MKYKLKEMYEKKAGIENESLLQFQKNILKDFELKESSSSCFLSDIQSFVYGPFTSRFWMLRKHILLMDKNKLQKDPPFYGWDCITITVKTSLGDLQDISLIIRSESTMTNFLKLLIHRLETLNGHKDSAVKLKNKLLKDRSKM